MNYKCNRKPCTAPCGKFIEDENLIEHAFSADLGTFLDVDYKRRILSESLSVNESKIFVRGNELEFGSFQSIEAFMVNAFEQNEDGAKALAKSNLNDEELFLMNGFKNMSAAIILFLILVLPEKVVSVKMRII